MNVALSPNQQHPILLATRTSVEQVGASFSTAATLDLYSPGLGDPSNEMHLKGSIGKNSLLAVVMTLLEDIWPK